MEQVGQADVSRRAGQRQRQRQLWHKACGINFRPPPPPTHTHTNTTRARMRDQTEQPSNPLLVERLSAAQRKCQLCGVTLAGLPM